MVITSSRERTQRAREMASALASVRIEGIEPSDEGKAVFESYVAGEISLEQMGRAIDELHDRLYGPVRLSGNDHS